MPARPGNRGPLYLSFALLVALVLWFLFPFGRHETSRFLGSLRMDKPQRVNVNLSEFVGPDANHSLQQMVTQMISDQVVTTVSESPETVSNAETASQVAGFPVKVLGGRSDAPSIAVLGAHAFKVTVDRNRLQTIFDEAGRHDLTVPQSVNGSVVSVRIPREAVLHYGTCPGRSSVAANIATPPPATTHYANCVILQEGPSPSISAPPDVDLEQLTEIALELAGMTPGQARQFLARVDWKSMLGFSFQRNMRSYQTVNVDGAPGTLLTLGGRRGPDYALIWVKNGIVYSLRGFGDSSDATKLAASLT